MLFVNTLFSGSTRSHFWSLTADTLLPTSQATNTYSHLISSSHSHLSLFDLYSTWRSGGGPEARVCIAAWRRRTGTTRRGGPSWQGTQPRAAGVTKVAQRRSGGDPDRQMRTPPGGVWAPRPADGVRARCGEARWAAGMVAHSASRRPAGLSFF